MVAAFARMRVGGDAWVYPRSGERGYVVALVVLPKETAPARQRLRGPRHVPQHRLRAAHALLRGLELVELGNHFLGVRLHRILTTVAAKVERAAFGRDLEWLTHCPQLVRADGANGLRDGGFLLVGRKLLDVGELLGRELHGCAEGFESALLGPSSLGPSLVLAGPEVSDGFASILPSAAFASILPSPGVALGSDFFQAGTAGFGRTAACPGLGSAGVGGEFSSPAQPARAPRSAIDPIDLVIMFIRGISRCN